MWRLEGHIQFGELLSTSMDACSSCRFLDGWGFVFGRICITYYWCFRVLWWLWVFSSQQTFFSDLFRKIQKCDPATEEWRNLVGVLQEYCLICCYVNYRQSINRPSWSRCTSWERANAQRAFSRFALFLGWTMQSTMDEQVMLQLQTLVGKKAEWIQDNSRLKTLLE